MLERINYVEELRLKLNKLVEQKEYNFQDPEVLLLSKKLDTFLNATQVPMVKKDE